MARAKSVRNGNPEIPNNPQNDLLQCIALILRLGAVQPARPLGARSGRFALLDLLDERAKLACELLGRLARRALGIEVD